MTDNINDPLESGAVLPAPGPNASLDELKAAYVELEQSDCPEFLKQRCLFDLGDRIRDFGKPPEPAGTGVSLSGMSPEQIHHSGFRGRVWTGGDGDGWVRA